MKLSWQPYTLHFKRPSGTSRGLLHKKTSYFLRLEEGDLVGLGECGLLKGLSVDDRPDYEDRLRSLQEEVATAGIPALEELKEWPSIRMGLEMARRDLKAPAHVLFPSEFTEGLERQPINGLIWMGDPTFMRAQADDLLARGFMVIKLKIGAIDWETELKLLRYLRGRYGPAQLQLRVDANGAFAPGEALAKMEQLDELRVHSIEQPIAKGQWEYMARLCQQSPLPVALDEELIGVHDRAAQIEMLERIKPRFLILKPSLLGGFAACEQWIELAEERGIAWWVTSALESNYGLSAIAQWNYTLHNSMASGLGTGSLFTNNFPAPLHMVRGTVAYDPEGQWNLSGLKEWR